MDCSKARTRLFQSLDGELSDSAARELDFHLTACPACAREKKILSIPRRIGQCIPALQPSPYFYSKLRARLESESEAVTIWQIILGLSRHLVPGLAAITLALLSVFAYFQVRQPQVDVYQAYDRIFQSSDRPQRMIIADPGEITDESVVQSMAEVESAKRPANGSDRTKK